MLMDFLVSQWNGGRGSLISLDRFGAGWAPNCGRWYAFVSIRTGATEAIAEGRRGGAARNSQAEVVYLGGEVL